MITMTREVQPFERLALVLTLCEMAQNRLNKLDEQISKCEQEIAMSFAQEIVRSFALADVTFDEVQELQILIYRAQTDIAQGRAAFTPEEVRLLEKFLVNIDRKDLSAKLLIVRECAADRSIQLENEKSVLLRFMGQKQKEWEYWDKRLGDLVSEFTPQSPLEASPVSPELPQRSESPLFIPPFAPPDSPACNAAFFLSHNNTPSKTATPVDSSNSSPLLPPSARPQFKT